MAEWQEVTALGEALLAEEGCGGQGVDWAALAALERAIALQPDFAM